VTSQWSPKGLAFVCRTAHLPLGVVPKEICLECGYISLYRAKLADPQASLTTPGQVIGLSVTPDEYDGTIVAPAGQSGRADSCCPTGEAS